MSSAEAAVSSKEYLKPQGIRLWLGDLFCSYSNYEIDFHWRGELTEREKMAARHMLGCIKEAIGSLNSEYPRLDITKVVIYFHKTDIIQLGGSLLNEFSDAEFIYVPKWACHGKLHFMAGVLFPEGTEETEIRKKVEQFGDVPRDPREICLIKGYEADTGFNRDLGPAVVQERLGKIQADFDRKRGDLWGEIFSKMKKPGMDFLFERTTQSRL